jgi:SAM-dependent methyltransferase
MLAPRKTLWSTPDTIISTAWIWIRPLLEEDSKICDVGCGDGRVLLSWARAYTAEKSSKKPPTFWGIDIDSERIQQARRELERAQQEGSIDPALSVTFVCQNALEHVSLFADAHILFLYLIPRGLRLMYPLLANQYVVTYMAPLSTDETPRRHEMIAVPHQPGAAWPLYLYKLDKIRLE